MIKDILIFSQSGLPEKYTKWAVEALEEYMSWFPDYKDDFLIKNCDNYGGQDKLGIDWYEKAKISAAGKGHTGQVYADALFKHIKEDALLKNKPYLTVILLKDDLFTDGYAWIYGMGDRVKPSLCDVCYAKVRVSFALWSKNADRINKEVANFNKVIKSDREHTHKFFYDARGQIYTENNRLISSKRLQDLLGR